MTRLRENPAANTTAKIERTAIGMSTANTGGMIAITDETTEIVATATALTTTKFGESASAVKTVMKIVTITVGGERGP